MIARTDKRNSCMVGRETKIDDSAGFVNKKLACLITKLITLTSHYENEKG
jgi:hypothetical protein